MKTKKLRLDVVRRELELLAWGAQGCEVVPDRDTEWPTLLQCYAPEDLGRFASAVQERFFQKDAKETLLFDIVSGTRHWENFDTLAEQVVAERKRLDLVAARKEAEKKEGQS